MENKAKNAGSRADKETFLTEAKAVRKEEYPNPNPTQVFIKSRFGHLVGKMLSQIESAFPEGRQCDAVKSLLEISIYDTRNELLRYFADR